MKTKYRLPKLLMFLSLFTLSFIPYLSTKAFSKTVYSFFGDKGTYLASYGNPDLNSQYRLIGNFAGGQYDVYDDLLFGNFIELNPGSSNPYYVVRFKLFTGNGSAFTGGVDLPGQFQPADYKTANINGDSYTDLVYPLENANGRFDWYWLRNTGTQFVEGGLLKTAYGGIGDDFYVIDTNGDYKDDIVVVSSANNSVGDLSWYLLQSTGTALVDKGKVIAEYGKVGDQIHVGDFNGDLKKDFLLVTPRFIGGGILSYVLLQSNGVTFTNKGVILDYYGMQGDGIVVGDYNKDGKHDICVVVGREADHLLDWYVATSDGTKLVSQGKWMDNYGQYGDIYYNVRTQYSPGKLKSEILVGQTRTNNGNSYGWSILQPGGYQPF